MSLDETSTIIDWLLHAAVSLSALIAAIRYRRLTPALRYLALLAFFDTLSEYTASVISKVLHAKSNLFLFPIILTGELWLIALLYREALQSATFTKAVPWLVGLFGLYGLLDQLAHHASANYAPGVQVVNYLLILMMAGLYYRKLLNDLQVEHLSREPVFIFSICLTVYALGNLLIALFSNYILFHYSFDIQFIILRIVRNFFNIELYIGYSVVLWMRPQK